MAAEDELHAVARERIPRGPTRSGQRRRLARRPLIQSLGAADDCGVVVDGPDVRSAVGEVEVVRARLEPPSGTPTSRRRRCVRAGQEGRDTVGAARRCRGGQDSRRTGRAGRIARCSSSAARIPARLHARGGALREIARTGGSDRSEHFHVRDVDLNEALVASRAREGQRQGGIWRPVGGAWTCATAGLGRARHIHLHRVDEVRARMEAALVR